MRAGVEDYALGSCSDVLDPEDSELTDLGYLSARR